MFCRERLSALGSLCSCRCGFYSGLLGLGSVVDLDHLDKFLFSVSHGLFDEVLHILFVVCHLLRLTEQLLADLLLQQLRLEVVVDLATSINVCAVLGLHVVVILGRGVVIVRHRLGHVGVIVAGWHVSIGGSRHVHGVHGHRLIDVVAGGHWSDDHWAELLRAGRLRGSAFVRCLANICLSAV